MKKHLFAIALMCGTAMAMFAAGDKEVNVLYLDGTPHVVKMTEVDKIMFSSGNVDVVLLGGSSSTHKISDIDKIEFRDGTSAIAQMKNDVKDDVIVRSDGYSIDVSGLADGTDVLVYTQNGMLIGKAKSKSGSAQVDASAYGNGVYVVKAGGRSLKMIKK